MNDNTRSSYIIAGAVIVAGLIIAAGIAFGGSQSATDNTDTQTSGSENSQIVAAAQAAGVDAGKVQQCLDSDKFKSDIRAEINDARSAGGRGTPFNVLVLANPLTDQARSQISGQLGDNITISSDGRRLAVSGAIPLSPMQQIIDTALANQQSAADTSTSSDISISPINESDHIRGSRNAKLTVVEYSDFKCPYCKRFHKTMKQVMDNYEDDQVAWVFRHMPIQQLHPQAPKLARASECVADIGGEDAFWTFADEVFKSS